MAQRLRGGARAAALDETGRARAAAAPATRALWSEDGRRLEAEQDGAIAFLTGLLDATPNPLVVKDDDLRWVLVNDAMCRMFGLPRERLLGSTDLDHSPPAEAAHFAAHDRAVLATGAVDVCEEDHTSPSGERRRLLTRKSRLRLADGRSFLICLVTDVSELARYRAELEARNLEAQRLLAEAAAARERAEAERRLLEHAAAVFPHGFAVADAEGRVVLANEAFGRALGLHGEGGGALAGRPVDALAAAALPAAELATWREAHALGDGQAVQLALPGEVWLVLRARRSDDGRTVLSLVDVSGFKRNEAALTRLALEDHLTGLANRRHLAEAGRSAVLHARRHGRPLSLLLLDIDHFKRVNDGFGHDAGDAVLRRFGELCRAGFRAGDTVGRIGGEEFAALLPDTDLAGAVTLAERLRASVAAEVVRHGDSRIAFSVSVGAAELAPAARDFDSFLKAADGALYAAKRAGRDRVCAAPP